MKARCRCQRPKVHLLRFSWKARQSVNLLLIWGGFAKAQPLSHGGKDRGAKIFKARHGSMRWCGYGAAIQARAWAAPAPSK